MGREGPPLVWGGGCPAPWGEEGLDGVWKRRDEEEEVGWRARGPNRGYLLSSCGRGGGELGARAPRGSRAWGPGAAAAGGGGSVVGAYESLPKGGVLREKTIPNNLEINQVTHAMYMCLFLPLLSCSRPSLTRWVTRCRFLFAARASPQLLIRIGSE